jgi:hypothetical protein
MAEVNLMGMKRFYKVTDFSILLRGIQLTYVQSYQGSTVKMMLSYKIFTLNEANTVHMWRSRMTGGVQCAHFPSVITTIMDHKVQLLKPLNKRELYTT